MSSDVKASNVTSGTAKAWPDSRLAKHLAGHLRSFRLFIVPPRVLPPDHLSVNQSLLQKQLHCDLLRSPAAYCLAHPTLCIGKAEVLSSVLATGGIRQDQIQ